MARKITRKRLQQVLHYDPLTGRWTWLERIQQQRKVGDTAGTIDKKGYRRIEIEGKFYQSSRLAWFYMKGRWPKKQIDHEDRDKGNDAWENLRPASNGQNKANSVARRDSKLGIKGVSLFRGKYRALLTAGGKLHYLGSFDTPEAASAAYAERAKVEFGEFARA